MRAFGCRPNRDFLQALPPRKKHIVALELVTMLIAYQTWETYLKGRPFTVYIDNDAANRACVKGFSKRGDLGRMSGLWWMMMARNNHNADTTPHRLST